ncbi:hypothetical protein Tco_0280967 [Tanacetum coccineum]
MGDFNDVLFIADTFHGSKAINISMRNLNERVNNIEIADVNNTGSHYTWNQKPKGKTCILKKIDQVMSNIGFNNDYPGNNQKRVVDLRHELDEVQNALQKDPSSTTFREEGLFEKPLSNTQAEKMVRVLKLEVLCFLLVMIKHQFWMVTLQLSLRRVGMSWEMMFIER